METFDPIEHRIFEGIVGSQLYGTSTPESDLDTRGVCIPPIKVQLNPFENFEQKDSGFEEEDRTIYNLSKFMKLCADSNPNIVELLFVPEDKILFKTKEWDYLIENKQYFLSTKAKFTFTGYAFSQLNKIKSHRQWFVDPPKKKPERKDFGLGDKPIISGENLSFLLNTPLDIFKEAIQEELNRERAYREEKKKWDNYVAWRDNRNPKRRATEELFGYDTKYASHIFRLMSEGKELLLTGKITFPLPNAFEITAIKNGFYEYEKMIENAEAIEKEFEMWYNESILPKFPDRNALTEVYYNILDMRGSLRM